MPGPEDDVRSDEGGTPTLSRSQMHDFPPAQKTRMAESEACTAEALQARLSAIEAKLARAVTERDTWAQELFESKRFLAELVVARQSLADELVRLNGLLANAQQERDHAERTLGIMQASTSWWMTRPIRAILRTLGRRSGAGA